VTISRRTLLGAAGAAGALTATGGYRLLGESADAATTLPPPATSGIEHVVVLTMENRSFDHFLGWLPKADGQQAGLTYVDRYRVPHNTHHLTVTSSCGFQDPDHSYEGGRIELNGGQCDGWLRAGQNDTMSIGYYEQADLEFLGQAAPYWTTCDGYYASTMAETYPNRFYMHCAQTDRLHSSYNVSTMTTIWDRLKAKGVSGKYYYGDIPFAVLLGTHAPPARALVGDPLNPAPGTFFYEAAAGTLPAVSYVDPRFQNEDAGTSDDDHPHADIRAGEAFMNQVYDAVRTSPTWNSTVLVITYDEWGGFFDHVPPGHAQDVARKTSLRGFRVPTLVISPFARRHHVAHRTMDHTSILKMIEWRWGLKALTVRDYHANNLARVLDFASPPNPTRPAFTVTPFDGTTAGCPTQAAETGVGAREWAPLKKMAREQGWEIG
jgi:phospholipase C